MNRRTGYRGPDRVATCCRAREDRRRRGGVPISRRAAGVLVHQGAQRRHSPSSWTGSSAAAAVRPRSGSACSCAGAGQGAADQGRRMAGQRRHCPRQRLHPDAGLRQRGGRRRPLGPDLRPGRDQARPGAPAGQGAAPVRPAARRASPRPVHAAASRSPARRSPSSKPAGRSNHVLGRTAARLLGVGVRRRARRRGRGGGGRDHPDPPLGPTAVAVCIGGYATGRRRQPDDVRSWRRPTAHAHRSNGTQESLRAQRLDPGPEGDADGERASLGVQRSRGRHPPDPAAATSPWTAGDPRAGPRGWSVRGDLLTPG